MCHLSSQRSGPCDETCCHWESVGGVSFKHIICQHAANTHAYTHIQISTHTHTCTASLYSFWHSRPGDNSVTVCKVCMHGFVRTLTLPPGCMSVCFCAPLCVSCILLAGETARRMAHGKCVSKSQKHLSPSVCVYVFVCLFVCMCACRWVPMLRGDRLTTAPVTEC